MPCCTYWLYCLHSKTVISIYTRTDYVETVPFLLRAFRTQRHPIFRTPAHPMPGPVFQMPGPVFHLVSIRRQKEDTTAVAMGTLHRRLRGRENYRKNCKYKTKTKQKNTIQKHVFITQRFFSRARCGAVWFGAPLPHRNAKNEPYVGLEKKTINIHTAPNRAIDSGN